MNPKRIDEVIRNADLDEICNPQTGDCVSVAVAINEVFGGEYVCGYQFPVDRRPAHATVEINGVLYDGSGSTSLDALYDLATSGLKESERQNFDSHIGEVKSLKDNALFDVETKENVKSRIIKNIN